MDQNIQVLPETKQPEIVTPIIKHVDIKDIAKYIKEQAQDFDFSPLEYIPGPDEKKQSIFLKVANVMGAIERIPKTGYNSQHQYHYATESDVVGAVRPLMAKEKLVMFPSIRNYKTEEFKTKYSSVILGTIEIEWILRDAESYEQVKFTMLGKGTDTMEKDIYKSITGNKKYALITLFMIDSGDDPERNDSPSNDYGNQTSQNGPDSTKKPNEGKRTGQNKNAGKGQNNANKNNAKKEDPEPEEKQPTKGDLITRWVIIASTVDPNKPKGQQREGFDEWYEEKKKEGKDHRWMLSSLTKKLHEVKQKAEEKAKEGQEDQGAENE